MRLEIDYEECLKDSPKFRAFLDKEEQLADHLEAKVDRVIKLCTIAVDSGKEYVKNQSAFATSLWDLNVHFQEDKTAHNALGKIIHCLQEMNKFHTILLDQASRTILKNMTSFVRKDVKEIKDLKQLFSKVSESLDSSLLKNAQANKNKSTEVLEAGNILSASQRCFRHTALDYVTLLTMMRAKKVPEILSTLLSYYQACNTFYHQGSDLCNDFEEFFKGLHDDINDMRMESNQLEKTLQNRHLSVNQFTDDGSTKDEASSLIEGYLFKRTSKGFKTWNRRWFYLCNHQLVYRKRSGEDFPTVMEEDLRICTVRPVNDSSDRRFCFEVISPTKSHILQADSQEMLCAWIAALHKSIGAAILHSTRSDNVTLGNDFQREFPGSSSHKKINWEEFLKIPGNDKCCDCGSDEPRWASINLGITLCIACSGVHRSLGVHYSKVRSLTLDAWEPEIVKVMRELGNDIVNQIYEARVLQLENVSPITRATDNCDTSTREAWIKAKYVERRFVASLDDLKMQQLEAPTSSAENANIENEEVPVEQIARNAMTRWSVRKIRRRRRSRKSDDNPELPTNASNSIPITDPPLGVFVFGNELSVPEVEAQFSLSSDQESSGGEEDLIEDEDIEKLTPNLLLYKASAAHNLPVMCKALALGATTLWINVEDRNRTALHQAVLSGSVMACEFLILNGTSINVQEASGMSPLHLATVKGCTAQAYLLLKHKAKHDLVDENGKQPIDIAVEQANADIVTLLRLTKLNEEIGYADQGQGEVDTYNDVMKDFSRFACTQPHRLQHHRNKSDQSNE